MGRRCLTALLACAAIAMAAPVGPARAHHVQTSATVSALVTELRSEDYWTVEIRWTSSCTGVVEGSAWHQGDLYMIDADSGERIYVGGVVNTSGRRTVSETREWAIASTGRARTLVPELTIQCYEHFPLHGGPAVTVTGASILVPQRFGAGPGEVGGGGRGGGGGAPTEPLGPNGCLTAVLGTNRPDVLAGSGAGDVIVAFAAADRLRGQAGHDCLIGGTGGDRLEGERGDDRLVGGGGRDVLADEDGINAFYGGSGGDVVLARNGSREPVRCGPGVDRAVVDRRDRARGCEILSRGR